MKKRLHTIADYSNPKIIAELSARLQERGLSAIEITTQDGQLKIETSTIETSPRAQNSSPVQSVSFAQTHDVLAQAPIAGIFLNTHPMREDKMIEKGQSVAKGDMLAFIRVGPVLVPVVAEKAGTLNAFAAEAGSLVGYGSALLKAKG